MPDLPAGSSAPESAPGPFTSTETKTIEISGPFKITITTKFDSSHVPPSTQTVESDGAGLLDALKPLAEIILSKLDEIRRAQGSQSC